MSVRAKFKVDHIQDGSEGLKTIYLNPVYDPNPDSENGRFWKYTPAGQIALSTINEAASSQFVIGREYYVDFTPAG